MRVGRRIVLVLVVFVLSFGLFVSTLLFVTVRRAWPQMEGSIAVEGLGDRVEVYRDRWGIPQIYASTATDLFFAQGFVHAQDRFWEMDFRRHVTAGRLSELFGEDQLDTDRFIRTLGWRGVAEQELDLLAPDTLRYLQAYSDGVNAYLSHRSGWRLGLEYAVLSLIARGYEPEPWTPTDSVAWLKAMAWDLRTNLETEIDRALMAAYLPMERIEELYPPYPYDRHSPIVQAGAVENGVFVLSDPGAYRDPASRRALIATARALDAASPVLGAAGDGIGSNSWVLHGSRTATGRPLLANDPHLGPVMPSLWYQMGLHCVEISGACPFDVAGFTFSGFPGVVIGHNDRIAWGLTNLGADVTDLYLERVSNDTYEHEGRELGLDTRTERIDVAGGESVEISVRTTRHGPLLSDVSDDLQSVADDVPATQRGANAVALRWTALEPGRTADTVFLLNRARDFDDFRDAARRFEVPSQNLVYADAAGNIGYQAPGKIPVRRGYDGRWPATGWTGDHDWKGYIDFDALPHVHNPPEGHIVAANQAVIGNGYAHLLTRDWSYGYRSQRILDMIEDTPGEFDVENMMAMQTDSHNAAAEVVVPHLLEFDVGEEVERARALLDGWNFDQPADSAPAAYFNAVWRHLLAATFHDEIEGGQRPRGGGRWFEVVRALLEEPDSEWWDDVSTPEQETKEDQLRAAVTEAHRELTETLGDDPSEWEWGELHTLDVTNASFGRSGIAPIERLFNRGPLHLGGGEDIVNATGWAPPAGYEVDWIPSMRMVVDLSDFDASRWINLTGSSGHPFHRNYFDQARLWGAGETTPWRFGRAAIESEAEHRLVLEPAP